MTFTEQDFAASKQFTEADFAPKTFTEDDFATVTATTPPEALNLNARQLPDMQAATRGGPPLSLPEGAAKSVMGEITEGIGESLSRTEGLGSLIPSLKISPETMQRALTATRAASDYETSGLLPSKTAEPEAVSTTASVLSGGTEGLDELVRGVSDFFTTPSGMAQLGAAATPIAPAVYLKWTVDMLNGGFTSIGGAWDAFQKSDYRKASKDTVVAFGMFLGARAAAKHGYQKLTPIIEAMPRGDLQGVRVEEAQQKALEATLPPQVKIEAEVLRANSAPATAAVVEQIARETPRLTPEQAEAGLREAVTDPAPNEPISRPPIDISTKNVPAGINATTPTTAVQRPTPGQSISEPYDPYKEAERLNAMAAQDAKKKPTPKKEKGGPVSDVLRRYDEGDPSISTHRDIADAVQELIDNGAAPKSLQKHIDKLKSEVEGGKEFGFRMDMEGEAGEALVAALERYAEKETAKPTPKPTTPKGPNEKEVQGQETPIGETPKRVKIAGEEYDVVSMNPDGTLKLKTEGGEFDTNVGEKWVEIAPREAPLTSAADVSKITRTEFIKREIDAKQATRKIAVLEAENAIRSGWKPKNPLPVGISKVQAFLAKERHTQDERKLLTKYTVAKRNLEADLRADIDIAGRVYDALKAKEQPQASGAASGSTPGAGSNKIEGMGAALDKTSEFINKGLSGQVGESQLGGGLGGVKAGMKSKAVTEDIPVKSEDLKSADPKVESRWQAAKLAKQSIWQKAKDAFTRSKNAMTRHFPKLDPKEDGAVTNILRVHEGTPLVSQYMASNAIRGITADLGPRKYGVFERVVILRDLIAYGEKFLAENKELPFGYESIDAMRADLSRFEAISERFPDIKEAVRRRNEFIEALRDDLVSRNLLPEQVKDFPAYFHHQVLEHMAMKESAAPGTGSSDVRTHRKGWQRKRVGSSKDFNTSYLESEFEVISQSFAQMMTQDTLGRIEAVADISKSLKDAAAKLKEEGREVDWRSLVPKDHVLWQPTKGNHFYWAQSLTEKALESFLRGEKELTAADFNEILALGGRRKEWVIPKRLAETLDEFGPQKDHAIEKFIGMGTSQWKRWTLFNPMRNLIYELNNLSGDADIAFAVDPKIFPHAPKAASELWNFVIGQKAATPKVDYLIKQGVVDAGFSVHELPDLKGQQFFRVLSGQEPGMIGQYWDTVLDFNRWREGVLRIAAYDRALERLNAGDQIYWTSKKAEIDGMRSDPNVTNQEIAAKLAREAIGDYGNISHAGQWIRSKAIPFYSWMEINAPRYVRLFQNVGNEPGGRGRASAVAGKRLVTGTAKTATKAAALYLLINLWNKTMFPDEEDELGLNQKQLHVILGRREDGSIISLRLQGAFSDALGWFGSENIIKDVEDVASGRTSVGDKLAESAKAPVNRIAGGSFPIQKTLVEATLGRQTFPDVFNPSQVRDSGKHIAKLFSVGTVYDYLTNKPQRPGTWSPLSLVTYTTDPGEAAYYASRSIVSDWLNKTGKDKPETMANDKSNALYYYKQALKYKDEKLAEFWKKKYFSMDGTEAGLKRSVAKSSPMAAISKKHKDEFMESLSPAEIQIMERAEAWYLKTY